MRALPSVRGRLGFCHFGSEKQGFERVSSPRHLTASGGFRHRIRHGGSGMAVFIGIALFHGRRRPWMRSWLHSSIVEAQTEGPEADVGTTIVGRIEVGGIRIAP